MKIHKLKKDKDAEISRQKFENAAKLRDKEKKLINKLQELQENHENVIHDFSIVSELDVADTVSMMTGIPIYKINEKE